MSEDTNSIVRYKLDASQSTFTVNAFAEGFLSSFGHDPTIGIVDFHGEAEFNPDGVADGKFQMEVDATTITVLSLIPLNNRVVSAEERERDRQDTEETMHNEILQSYRFPTIFFESTEITATKIIEGRFYKVKIVGNLTFHGVTRTGLWLMAHVTLVEDKMQTKGYFTLKQSDYEVELLKVAGGALKVQDEVKFDFLFTFHKEEIAVPVNVDSRAKISEIIIPGSFANLAGNIPTETEPANENVLENKIEDAPEVYPEPATKSWSFQAPAIQEEPVIESTEEKPAQSDIWSEGWREIASEVGIEASGKSKPEDLIEINDEMEILPPISQDSESWHYPSPDIANREILSSLDDDEIHLVNDDEIINEMPGEIHVETFGDLPKETGDWEKAVEQPAPEILEGSNKFDSESWSQEEIELKTPWRTNNDEIHLVNDDKTTDELLSEDLSDLVGEFPEEKAEGDNPVEEPVRESAEPFNNSESETWDEVESESGNEEKSLPRNPWIKNDDDEIPLPNEDELKNEELSQDQDATFGELAEETENPENPVEEPAQENLESLNRPKWESRDEEEIEPRNPWKKDDDEVHLIDQDKTKNEVLSEDQSDPVGEVPREARYLENPVEEPIPQSTESIDNSESETWSEEESESGNEAEIEPRNPWMRDDDDGAK